MSRLLRRFMTPARPRRRRASAKARLWLGALEERLVLATFTVTNTGDAGAGTGTSGDLRYCINQANAAGGTNVIDATGVTGTILTGSVLTIANSLTITGPDNNGLTINANGIDQVFTISSSGRTVVFKSLDITGGNTTAQGGGVYTGPNTVTFDTDWIYGNQTTTYGGGIGSSLGATITVENCAITANSAGYAGGGIFGNAYGYPVTTTLVVQNSTLSGNSGGGIVVAGRPNGPVFLPGYLGGTFSVHNSTIAGNAGVGIAAGGMSNIPVDLQSSIVSGNAGTGGDPDIYAVAVNAAHCAIGSTAGIANYHDLGGNLPVGTNLSLQPLKFNGGPTPTIALLAGTPATDTGSNPHGLAYDQRGIGFARESPTGAPDIGAFERQKGVPTAAVTAQNVTTGTNLTYQFTVTYADDASVLYFSVNGNSSAPTVTPPTGVPPVTVSFVNAVPASNAPTITATY